MFVDQVLKFVSQQVNTGAHTSIYIDMEVEYKLFNDVIKPDYLIMSKEEGLKDTPLYVFEVKRSDSNDKALQGNLSQHFKQLRHICIEHSKPQIWGVHTNFRHWYFTMYSLKREILNTKTSPDSLKERIFEISRPIEVLDPQTLTIKEENLKQVVRILEWLCIDF